MQQEPEFEASLFRHRHNKKPPEGFKEVAKLLACVFHRSLCGDWSVGSQEDMFVTETLLVYSKDDGLN